MTTADALQVITNVEAQNADGYTVGWIVPFGTDPGTDLELEALAHVDIPATEDDAEWNQGLRAALAGAGYVLAGPTMAHGRLAGIVTAPVRIDPGADYRSGQAIRPATAAEHAQSLAAGETGAFELDGRAVFVEGGPES